MARLSYKYGYAIGWWRGTGWRSEDPVSWPLLAFVSSTVARADRPPSRIQAIYSFSRDPSPPWPLAISRSIDFSRYMGARSIAGVISIRVGRPPGARLRRPGGLVIVPVVPFLAGPCNSAAPPGTRTIVGDLNHFERREARGVTQ